MLNHKRWVTQKQQKLQISMYALLRKKKIKIKINNLHSKLKVIARHFKTFKIATNVI